MLWRFLGICAVAGLLVVPGVAQASGPGCVVATSFSGLQQKVSGVGQCLGASYRAQGGDLVQPTAGGLLVFRQATSTPAFTDGYHTWVIGPHGLQERLNSQRFPWEESTGKGPMLGTAETQAPPVLRVLSTTIGATSGPLRFQVAGSGFHPDEVVTLAGTYTPLVGGPAPRTCRTFPLGPLEVHADENGEFRTSIETSNPHTGVNYFLRATGERSGPSNLALSVVTATC